MLEKKDKLTEIEEQIIYLISKELGNKEIAEKLNYSQRSICYKINNIFKKLNVNSRIGLIIEAVKQNII
ncbi:helix-turn-helix transcriptional regulator [Bacillus toyonensis]|uniref:response regulator transcription factor n=1 Tax=Bacillus TaxID=1386 RepID=UPI000BF15CDC|nr:MULTISPECIES: LuxR C-terminal-related transcriptional regulator [Bacillus]MBF7150678.1 response regulator transcription factor [Bacillus toyonensis]MBY7104974.1 response regulator transcription factor [Bacillus sp. 6YEL31]MBY7131321.1 response regulator transcription factor [Bacillus sp. 8YEL33]MEC2348188.1 LuxR C-terminal-related transcriptional regulator [Bacillus toyonensis]MED3188637.1 LuxR C-terminal-related transcriptional regulator [Bacillus toyonensis]